MMEWLHTNDWLMQLPFQKNWWLVGGVVCFFSALIPTLIVERLLRR